MILSPHTSSRQTNHADYYNWSDFTDFIRHYFDRSRVDFYLVICVQTNVSAGYLGTKSDH
jgi:hypothetical protein